MKVDSSPFANGAQQGPQRAEASARTGQSFAALLATGRTVSSIRNERALGFSETGLLGAHRIVAEAPATQSDRPPNNPHQSASMRRALSSRPAARSGTAPQQDVQTRAQERGRPFSLNRVSVSHGARSSQTHKEQIATPFTIFSPESFEYNVLWRDQSSPWFRRLRSSRVRRALNVSGTAEIIDVSAFDAELDDDQHDAIIENFLATARHFSVTLGAVKLNGKNVIIHRTQESERS